MPHEGQQLNRRQFLRSSAMVGGALLTGGLLEACSSGPTATSTTASSGHNGSSNANVGKGKTIGLAVNGNVPYTQYVATGVKEALKGTAYQLKITQADFNVETQLNNIESMLSTGIAGLVILAVSDAAANEGAAKAAAQGIPVANTLWPGANYPGQAAADKDYVAVAYVDSYKGGQLIGEFLKAHAKPGPTVVVQGIVGQGFSEVIDQGLNASLAGSGFDIVVRQQGFFSRTTAISIVQSALQAHPNVTTIVDYAAAMGDGIASYLQSRGIKHITHVTSDGDLEMVHKWLGTPYLAADRYYSAAQTGLLATVGLRQKLETGSAGPFVRDCFQGIATKANIASFEAAHPLVYQQYLSQVASL